MATIDHDVPFQRSANVPSALRPTAKHVVAFTQDTPAKSATGGPVGLALGTTDQAGAADDGEAAVTTDPAISATPSAARTSTDPPSPPLRNNCGPRRSDALPAPPGRHHMTNSTDRQRL